MVDGQFTVKCDVMNCNEELSIKDVSSDSEFIRKIKEFGWGFGSIWDEDFPHPRHGDICPNCVKETKNNEKKKENGSG